MQEALHITAPDIVQKAGSIQFFEMCSELSWNLLKDYLKEQGFLDVQSPRSAIKKAFELGLIQNGHTWLELLADRNKTSHIYDEEQASEIAELVREKYFPEFKALQEHFRNLANDERKQKVCECTHAWHE